MLDNHNSKEVDIADTYSSLKIMTFDLIKIWNRAVEGDTDAWNSLVEKYSRLVYSIINATGISIEDADDCAQQTWVDLYNSRDKIREPEKLPGWLIKVAQRKAFRLIHKRSLTIEADSLEATPSSPELPNISIEALQQRAQLELALEQLDDRCQKVLRALFFAPEDQSYSDIAKSVGIPANSLGPTRSRCLAKLKMLLEDMSFEQD